MKVGIIGTGNMGTILTEALIGGKAISPSSITITNRTIEKAELIQKQFPEVTIAQTVEEVVKNVDLIFICIKPLDIFPLISTIQPLLTKEQCVISITSPVSVEQLAEAIPCSVARVIPSITNRALAGVSLVTYDKNCKESWKETIETLMSKVSTPLLIDQDITRVSSDIVSCGPAFFSFLTQKLVEAAVRTTAISEEKATKLAEEMLIGLGELLRQKHYTLPTLQEKVCVKGGITGEGIKVLESGVGDMFDLLFEATHRKFDEDLEKISKQLMP